MKRGFTLIEVLSVIVILGVIALIAFPAVDNTIKNSRQKAYEQNIANIEAAALSYSVSKDLGYDETYKKLELQTLKDAGLLKDEDIINPVNNSAMTGCVLYIWNNSNNQYKFKYSEDCALPEFYVDNSGANAPELLNNMIPVKYVNGSWVYANVKEKWYDYRAKEWANAVVLNSGVTKTVGDTISESDIALMYVWIPRYTYTIFNGNNGGVSPQVINVKFESGTNSSGTVTCVDNVSGSGTSSETCTDLKNGSVIDGKSTYTHPAFTFGGKELTGFWVGKFELSGTTSKVTIKPNVTGLYQLTASTLFYSIQNINGVYGINGDSHMIKNMEWGAVAYLKQSKYGLGLTNIGINNNSNYITGCGSSANSISSTTCNAYNTETGMLASTTGNVYGVYDMSGGAWEYVMGNMVNSSGEFYDGSAGFTTTPDSKYYDAYTYNAGNRTHGRGKLGDATKETLEIFGGEKSGWTNDYSYFVASNSPWIFRGGYHGNGENSGIFYFNYYSGGNDRVFSSSRAVLVNN